MLQLFITILRKAICEAFQCREVSNVVYYVQRVELDHILLSILAVALISAITYVALVLRQEIKYARYQRRLYETLKQTKGN